MIVEQILEHAIRKGVMIATAESCTGGLIAAALTDLPGSSAMFDRGIVTYSNAAKREQLRVKNTTLDRFGAVSEEVAAEMAQGVKDASLADICVSVTGIAGPGGSEHKPEGRVCFGLISGDALQTETVDFGALGRAEVRAAARDHALELILAALIRG